MAGSSLLDAVLNVVTGGGYGVGQAAARGRPLEAVATVGPFGNVAQPIVGTGPTLQAEAMGAGGAGGAALAPEGSAAFGAAAGSGLGQQAFGAGGALFPPGMPPMPDPTAIAMQQVAADRAKALQGQVGKSGADAASRGLSGASPDFLANMTAQEAGYPQAGQEALDLVRRYYA